MAIKSACCQKLYKGLYINDVILFGNILTRHHINHLIIFPLTRHMTTNDDHIYVNLLNRALLGTFLLSGFHFMTLTDSNKIIVSPLNKINYITKAKCFCLCNDEINAEKFTIMHHIWVTQGVDMQLHHWVIIFHTSQGCFGMT